MFFNMMFAVLTDTNPVAKGSKVTVNRVFPELTAEQKASIAAQNHRTQVAMTVLSILGVIAFVLYCIMYRKSQRKYEEKKAKIYAKAQAEEQRKILNDINKEYSQTSQNNSTEFKLSELKSLHDKGIITQEEYDAKRKKIIDNF